MEQKFRIPIVSKFSLFIYILFLIKIEMASAYPELTRFHYNTCSACHVSPAGGGLISPYGRKLSQEVLTTWGSEQETAFLHGLVPTEKLEEWLLLGANVRSSQVHYEDSIMKKGRFIPMQLNFDTAVLYQNWTGYLSLGEIKNNKWKLYPDTAYVMWRPQEEWVLRTGKFIPQYGLILPDHILFIRQFLGFGLEASRLSFEVQKNGETWIENISLSKHDEEHGSESALSAQVQYYFNDSSKVAINAWQGKDNLVQRNLVGLWGILSLTQKAFWLTEFDSQVKKDILGSSGATTSQVHYNKIGYTLAKGVDFFIHEEAMQSNTKDPQTLTTRRGLGMQFFPRPHFDFQGVFTKQVVNTTQKQESDYAWLILHYYL